ncbi:MAG: LamG domain-containing protein [Verrucomicrobia bacterium]|nr:LamG domain-containing protein [Verrucomicrobiota bacterium]
MKNKQKELFRLMSARHDGILDEEKHARLADLLEGDKDAQRYYLELGSMFHELEETFHGHCADTVVQEFPARRAKVVPMVGWATAIAASLVAAFLLVPRSGNERSELLVDTESTILMNDECSFIARVIASDGLEWSESNTVEIRDGQLKPGLLDLKKGSLDVIFDNGVRFAFIAPVSMDMSSLQRLSIRAGKFVMDVPGLADGLVVTTPDAVLKTHTVRAHVSCGKGEPTLVNVEKGAMNLYTENQGGREIRKNIVGKESVEIARGTKDPIVETRRVIEPRIDLSLPPELENLQYVHYRFDEQRGNKVKNHGTIKGGHGYLQGLADNPEYPAPRRVAGRFRRALEFTGHGEGMIADIKEFGVDEPGSVAFWIKMDPDTVPGEYENIFTWHMYRFPKKAWHDHDATDLACRIRINDSSSEGVVGAVRIEFRDKWICGTTDLRDGRWHHVTAVFHRGYPGTVVRHYIDGQLARSSARGKTWFPRERYADIGGGSIAVGRLYWPKRPKTLSWNDSCGLRGMVDELYVFNQAVLPSHASSLRMKNTPNQVLDVVFTPWARQSIAMLPIALPRRAD